MKTDDRICIEIYFDSASRSKKIKDFSIHYRAKINGKWEDILRVDTEAHGNIENKGVAHAHHFYKNKGQWYQPLDTDLDDIFNSWLKNILKRSRHLKNIFLYNK